MPLRVSFVGFRHGHIHSLYALLQERADVEVVAACEEHAATRAALRESDVAITHDSYEAMLADADCDVVACGEYYGGRGRELIRALELGKHVIGDKPLCTRLDELDAIEELARASELRVGCMLDLINLGPYRTLRRLVRAGTIGEVHTVCFSGQHPLNYGSRPGWYFEEDKHGGTLNDIVIHAVDAIPWITGRTIVEVTAARAWNARLEACPSFQDGAQVMLRLDNGGGVIGDVSYLTPEAIGYGIPSYWRFTIHGADGCLETACNAQSVLVFSKGADQAHEETQRTAGILPARCQRTDGISEKAGRMPAVRNPGLHYHRVPEFWREESVGPGRPGGYLEDFLADLAGRPTPDGLDTARVLRSSRVALTIQAAADTEEFPRPL